VKLIIVTRRRQQWVSAKWIKHWKRISW